MDFPWIHALTVPNPDFICVDDTIEWEILQLFDLPLQFQGVPIVVAVQKGYPRKSSQLNAGVPRCGHTSIILKNVVDSSVPKLDDSLLAGVRGTIIDDDQLPISKGLVQNRLDGLSEECTTIKGRDNDADQKIVTSPCPFSF